MSLALKSLFKDAQSKNQIYLANKQKSLNYKESAANHTFYIQCYCSKGTAKDITGFADPLTTITNICNLHN